MAQFTMQELKNTVLGLTKANPDNIYKGFSQGRCFYSKGKCNNGSTGCIFGQAFKKLGVSRRILSEFDTNSLNVTISTLLNKFASSGILTDYEYDDGSFLRWCIRVQTMQDDASTWETAIIFANKH